MECPRVSDIFMSYDRSEQGASTPLTTKGAVRDETFTDTHRSQVQMFKL